MRLYDAILAHTKELAEVASQVGGAAGEALMDECAAKVWQPATGTTARLLHDLRDACLSLSSVVHSTGCWTRRSLGA